MNRRVARIAMHIALMAAACAKTERVPLAPAHSTRELIESAPAPSPIEGAVLWGTVKELNGSIAVLALRENRTANVDFSKAEKIGRAITPTVGENVVVNGTISDGVLRARLMNRTKGPATWGADKPE